MQQRIKNEQLKLLFAGLPAWLPVTVLLGGTTFFFELPDANSLAAHAPAATQSKVS